MESFIIVLAVTGVAVAIYMVWRWRCALDEVANGLQALGEREKVRPVFTMAGGPIGKLVRAFNASANEVEARIAGLDQDRQQLLVVLGAMAEAVIAVDPRRRLLFANASANRLFGLDATSVGRLVPELIRSPQVQDAVEATLRLAVPAAYEGELILPGRDPAHRGQQPVSSRFAATPCQGRRRPGRSSSSMTSPSSAGSSGCGKTSSPTRRTSSRRRSPRSRRIPKL